MMAKTIWVHSCPNSLFKPGINNYLVPLFAPEGILKNRADVSRDNLNCFTLRHDAGKSGHLTPA
jgi:hypothetical protein